MKKYTIKYFILFSIFSLNIKAQNVNIVNQLVTSNTSIVSSNIDLENNGVINAKGEFYLKNNFINNSSLISNSGKFIFDSQDSLQFISGTSISQFYNFKINNGTTGNSLTLNQSIKIENNADFSDGIMLSSSSSFIEFLDGAISNLASDSSHVKGPVKKTGNDSFIFPLGSGSSYNPCSISAPLLVSDQFTSEYFETDPHPFYSRNLKEPSVNHISKVEYWTLDRTNGSSDVSLTLFWDTLSQVDTLDDLIIVRWDGSQWKNQGNSLTTGDINDGNIISGNAITAFSPFTFASVSTFNPLPIELLYFNVKKEEKRVLLKWSTESEIDNDYFVIERSNSGTGDWSEILTKPGAGTSNTIIDYIDYDYAPIFGDSYYRLKQVDFNGEFTYSSIRHILFDHIDKGIAVYPNPAKENISISIDKLEGNVKISIYNKMGQRIKSIETNTKLSIIPISDIANGIYIVKVINNGGEIFTSKLVINH